LHRPVKVAEAPLEAVVPTFTSFGISADVAGLYRDMYQALREGRLVFEGNGNKAVEHVRGKTTVEEGLRPLLGA
jgi:hypothetical protein